MKRNYFNKQSVPADANQRIFTAVCGGKKSPRVRWPAAVRRMSFPRWFIIMTLFVSIFLCFPLRGSIFRPKICINASNVYNMIISSQTPTKVVTPSSTYTQVNRHGEEKMYSIGRLVHAEFSLPLSLSLSLFPVSVVNGHRSVNIYNTDYLGRISNVN